MNSEQQANQGAHGTSGEGTQKGSSTAGEGSGHTQGGSSRSSGWARHLLWIVPLGCLAPVLICCGGGTLFFVFVFGTLKSSPATTGAMSQVRANKEVQIQLGEPIEMGYLVTGSIKTNNSSGSADLTIPISGPKGSATVYVKARRTAGSWRYTKLDVVIKETGKRIDVIAEHKR